MNQRILQVMAALLTCWAAHAQVNSGSNGSDGAFNPATNTVINLADHPNGIYHYPSVNIPSGVTVTFVPGAKQSLMDARPHPNPLPQEREKRSPRLGELGALGFRAAFSANNQKAAIATQANELSSDVHCCSLSLGERARVRASDD